MTLGTTANPSHTRGDANPALTAALAITVIAAATLAGAWFFQLVLDIRPCPLCLEQRYAYYLAVPLGALIAVAAARDAPRAVLYAGLAILAAANRLHRPGRKSRQRRQFAGASRQCEGDPLRRGAVALPRPVARRLQFPDLAIDGRDRGVGHRAFRAEVTRLSRWREPCRKHQMSIVVFRAAMIAVRTGLDRLRRHRRIVESVVSGDCLLV